MIKQDTVFTFFARLSEVAGHTEALPRHSVAALRVTRAAANLLAVHTPGSARTIWRTTQVPYSPCISRTQV